MEDNKVLDVVEAVPIQSQIENETLDAFTPMNIDSVLNNAQASVDVEPVPEPRKRGRLMKNGAFATNNVANLVSSDKDNEIQTNDKLELNEEGPITFTRSKKKQRTVSNPHRFTVIDEATDDEDELDDEDGIDLEDSENCSQESTYEEDEEDDLDDFIDDEDATSVETDDEYNDDDF